MNLQAAPVADDLEASVKTDYDRYLAPLFEHFHRNPEFSNVETETARQIMARRDC